MFCSWPGLERSPSADGVEVIDANALLGAAEFDDVQSINALSLPDTMDVAQA